MRQHSTPVHVMQQHSAPVDSTSRAVCTSNMGQKSGCLRMWAWYSSAAAASSICACCRATSNTCRVESRVKSKQHKLYVPKLMLPL